MLGWFRLISWQVQLPRYDLCFRLNFIFYFLDSALEIFFSLAFSWVNAALIFDLLLTVLTA